MDGPASSPRPSSQQRTAATTRRSARRPMLSLTLLVAAALPMRAGAGRIRAAPDDELAVLRYLRAAPRAPEASNTPQPTYSPAPTPTPRPSHTRTPTPKPSHTHTPTHAKPTPGPYPSPSVAPYPRPTYSHKPTHMPTVHSTAGVTMASMVFLYPYCFFWLLYGLFLIGIIPCNESYDDVYRCYNKYYSRMYGMENTPYNRDSEEDDVAFFGLGEGNYFRRCVAFAIILAACLGLSEFHKSYTPQSYEGEGALCEIGVMVLVGVALMALITHVTMASHARFRDANPSYFGVSVLIVWGIIILFLRAYSEEYDHDAVVFLWFFASVILVVMLVLFLQYALYGYRRLEAQAEALLKKEGAGGAEEPLHDSALSRFSKGAHAAFARTWNSTFHA